MGGVGGGIWFLTHCRYLHFERRPVWIQVKWKAQNSRASVGKHFLESCIFLWHLKSHNLGTVSPALPKTNVRNAEFPLEWQGCAQHGLSPISLCGWFVTFFSFPSKGDKQVCHLPFPGRNRLGEFLPPSWRVGRDGAELFPGVSCFGSPFSAGPLETPGSAPPSNLVRASGCPCGAFPFKVFIFDRFHKTKENYGPRNSQLKTDAKKKLMKWLRTWLWS